MFQNLSSLGNSRVLRGENTSYSHYTLKWPVFLGRHHGSSRNTDTNVEVQTPRPKCAVDGKYHESVDLCIVSTTINIDIQRCFFPRMRRPLDVTYL